MRVEKNPITQRFIFQVLLRGLLLFGAANLAFAAVQPASLGRLSAYNVFFPGRERLPFGENPGKSYNLSLYNLDAMMASHVVSGQAEYGSEFRVFILGDSSAWGTLLSPPETLAGQLNARGLQICGKPARFYNLGYPTISLAKDLLLLNRAMDYHPDRVIWLVTLEALPVDKQISSPLAANNFEELDGIFERLGITGISSVEPKPGDLLSRTILGRRRELADLLRLQLYGPAWAATGIDQDPEQPWQPAQTDFEADDSFHGLHQGDDLDNILAWQILDGGIRRAGETPILLINEPVLISEGKNSSIRYNLFYPRWAYDEYRKSLEAFMEERQVTYLDAWDEVPAGEFTNSAIHLTPTGEAKLAKGIATSLLQAACLP